MQSIDCCHDDDFQELSRAMPSSHMYCAFRRGCNILFSSRYVYKDVEEMRSWRHINANDNTAGTVHKLQNSTDYFGCVARKAWKQELRAPGYCLVASSFTPSSLLARPPPLIAQIMLITPLVLCAGPCQLRLHAAAVRAGRRPEDEQRQPDL